MSRLTEPFCSDPAMLDIEQLPEVMLSEEQVRTLALVLGEFSTNSNKYGALGHGGRIAITAEVGDGVLTLHWAERTYEQLVNSPKRELKIFTEREGGVQHSSFDNANNAGAYIADWVAEVLGGRVAIQA